MERLLGAEHLLAGGRVQPVRADHQVERPGRSSVEGDVDPLPGLVERGDRIAEQELHVVADRREQRVGQIAAPHLQVLSVGVAGDRVRVQGRHFAAVPFQERHPVHVDLRLLEPGKQTHAFDDAQGGAADVDGIPAEPWRVRLLDDGDLEAVTVQPVREGGARDTGPGDQDRPGTAAVVGEGHAVTLLCRVRTTKRHSTAVTPATRKPVTNADSAGTDEPAGSVR